MLSLVKKKKGKEKLAGDARQGCAAGMHERRLGNCRSASLISISTPFQCTQNVYPLTKSNGRPLNHHRRSLICSKHRGTTWQTVSVLHTLHSRWKDADFTFINLIAQLTALKAALSKLQEWMDADMDEPHHQLVMDLEASVTCCRMLVRRMDSEVEDLQQNSGTGLDAQNKIKLVIKNGALEELQKMVDRQTSALTLLLTVCNWSVEEGPSSCSRLMFL
jgi:hypothetical protein